MISNNQPGVLLIDKAQGLSSHDVVFKVRKSLGVKQIGHAGTLDPMATGLLVLLVGDATKVSDMLLTKDKSYECLIDLGFTSDTLDSTGKISACSKEQPSLKQVQEAIDILSGEFDWPIPMYSAKKINGKKLYELARKQEVLKEVPKKKMFFRDIDLMDYDYPQIRLRLSCSKGSFVRTWIDQLGKKLGVGAIMTDLRRLSSGKFHLDQAIKIEDLDNLNKNCASFISLDDVLSDLPKLEVKGFDSHLIKNGQISNDLRARLALVHRYWGLSDKQIFQIIASDGQLLALIKTEAFGLYKFARVFRP